MTTEEIIVELKKRKYQFIFFTVLIYILACGVQYRILQTFHGHTTFIVNATDVTDLEGSSEFLGDFINSDAASVNRILQFAYSSEMMSHIIKKFLLYERYQIDSSENFAYQKVVAELSENINLTKKDLNIIELTVTDRDRFAAASIANEITLMLNKINEAYIKTQLRRKVVLYEGVYVNVKNDLDQHEGKMLKILENYKFVLSTLEKGKADVESMKYALIDLTSSLKNKREELVKMKQLYSVMLQTLNKERMETITVIKTAMPDYKSNVPVILLISTFVALIGACAMILLLNAYLTHKKTFELLFKK